MAFASEADVEARLGRDLTAAEQTMVTFLLDAASAVVANAADKEVADVVPEPEILRFVTVEVIARAISNPSGLYSQTKSLGQFSHSQTFRKELSSDLFLTDTEETLVRRAILGQLSGSADTASLANDEVVFRQLAPSSPYYDWTDS